MRRMWVVLFWVVQSVYAQHIIKVDSTHVLLEGVTQAGDVDLLVYRMLDEMAIPVGLIKVIDIKSDTAFAIILQTYHDAQILPDDLVREFDGTPAIDVLVEQNEILQQLSGTSGTTAGEKDVNPANIPGVKQAHRRNDIGIIGGVSIPKGEGSEYWKSGANWGVYTLHEMKNRMLLGLQFQVHFLHFDKDEFLNDFAPHAPKNVDISGAISVINIGGHLRVPISAPQDYPQVYLQGGAAMYFMRASIKIGPSWSSDEVLESETSFGASLGVCLSFKTTSRSHFEFVPLYHYIDTDDEATHMITINLMYSFPL